MEDEKKTTKRKKKVVIDINDNNVTPIQEIDNNKVSKNTFNIVEVIVIMIITALFGVVLGSAVTYFRDKSGTSITSNKSLKELISTYYDVIDDYYGELDQDGLLEAGIKGMMDYLSDPYSSYFDAEESEEFNEKLDGEYVGLGAEITKEDGGNLVVKTVFDNSPAAKAGLQVDDVIYKIDDAVVKEMTLSETSEVIKGEKGTQSVLYILRDDKEVELEFTRDTIEITSVTGEVITKENQKIGLVTIEVFAKNSYQQFKEVIEELQSQKINYLIIDVRNNNGGYLTTVKSIAEMFLNKKDIVFIIEDKTGQEKQLSSQNGTVDVPVAILINGGSASASEILASTLNENIGAELVGLKTYGKGSVQKSKQLSSGAVIKYTTEKWLTPSGKSIDGNGVEPTVEIEQSTNYYKNPTIENDAQLQKAMELLLTK